MATLDVVNSENERVGSVEIDEALFGGRVSAGLIWEAVVQENASERRGTHATKTRGLVSGSGRKPWRQKGTGRARVGEIRNPLWRKGGTVFGPQPRSYGYELPRKVKRGALRAALLQKLQDGAVVVVDDATTAEITEIKTRPVAEMLKRLGAAGRTLLVDVSLGEALVKSSRNIAELTLASASRVTARDVIGARRIVVTKSALGRLQEALAS
jgi:large subunit ribosomal protein L4